ncbi:MAG: nuclear transport factor 2 family protein [Sphingomonadales bacterium]
MKPALAAIADLLSDYFDALHHCDVGLLQKVFHPRALYATADETPLLYRDMATYFSVVAARQSPASRNEARRDAIDAIDLAGENTACARVRCSIGDRDFVDFLSLVRDNGQWRIIAKVFQIIER